MIFKFGKIEIWKTFLWVFLFTPPFLFTPIDGNKKEGAFVLILFFHHVDVGVYEIYISVEAWLEICGVLHESILIHCKMIC